MTFKTVDPPDTGIWRVGRDIVPYYQWRQPPKMELNRSHGGNGFDSFHGTYGVLYFGTEIETCYAETLARFRPKPHLIHLAAADWEARGWMLPGNIPADWRQRRMLTRVNLVDPLPFLCVDSAETLAFLEEVDDLQPWWTQLGILDIDLATVMGQDRRITRLISQWAFDAVDEDGDPVFAGIKYTSRLGEGYECWAVFEMAEIDELERRPILATDPDLQAVAERYGLTMH